MSQRLRNLFSLFIVIYVVSPGRACQFPLAKENKKVFGKGYSGFVLHYGKVNLRMLLKGQIGKECFTLIAAQFVKSGFVMMIFLKKKVNVQNVLKESD